MSGDVRAAVSPQVDPDRPEPVPEPPGERVEQPGAEAVRVEEQQRLPGAAPSTAAIRSPSCSTVSRAGSVLGVYAAGSAAKIRPSVRSWGVVPPSVSSSCLASRK